MRRGPGKRWGERSNQHLRRMACVLCSVFGAWEEGGRLTLFFRQGTRGRDPGVLSGGFPSQCLSPCLPSRACPRPQTSYTLPPFTRYSLSLSHPYPDFCFLCWTQLPSTHLPSEVISFSPPVCLLQISQIHKPSGSNTVTVQVERPPPLPPPPLTPVRSLMLEKEVSWGIS